MAGIQVIYLGVKGIMLSQQAMTYRCTHQVGKATADTRVYISGEKIFHWYVYTSGEYKYWWNSSVDIRREEFPLCVHIRWVQVLVVFRCTNQVRSSSTDMCTHQVSESNADTQGYQSSEYNCCWYSGVHIKWVQLLLILRCTHQVSATTADIQV